jgi:drug/metabolite transporter (DMT)-like permease
MKSVISLSISLALWATSSVSGFTTPSSRGITHNYRPTKLQPTLLHMAANSVTDEPNNTGRVLNSKPVAKEPLPTTPDVIVASTQKSTPAPAMDALANMVLGGAAGDSEYKRGILTIGFITLLFSSNSPALHAAFSGTAPPPVLLLNAAVSMVALVGLLLGGESLESNTPLPSSLQQRQPKEQEDALAMQGGCELGLWKFLGTTANLYGLALTTAGHGALLIQLTTLIVPVVQGIQGVPIPRRIQFSVALALAGVVCFTQDATGSPSAYGDALCVLAAVFYATYDLRLFAWGKKVVPRRLITTKISTQAILSAALLIGVDWQASLDYLASDPNWALILPVVLWSGVAVNAVAPFLQVGGQQAVGPTRCQTIYASQPLWAALLSFFFLGEMVGMQGLLGGTAFLSALFLAATAEAPDANCEEDQCEV